MPDPTHTPMSPAPVVRPRLKTAPRINRFNIRQDGDSSEVIYDHEGCGAAEGPIYVVDPLTGKVKARIDCRKQGARHDQNVALGNFDKSRKGLEIAFCEKGSNIHLFDATGKLVWKRPVPASLLSRGDWDGNGRADVIMPFGEWHWGSDSILFLREGPCRAE